MYFIVLYCLTEHLSSLCKMLLMYSWVKAYLVQVIHFRLKLTEFKLN